MKLTGWLLVMSVLMLSLNGCAETVCTLEITQEQNFASATLEVGESKVARFKLLSCGGTRDITRSLTWTSENPEVATVGQKTGEIIGRSEGRTRVTVVAQYGSDRFGGEDSSYVDVTVVAP